MSYEVNKHEDKVLELKKYLVLIKASPKGFSRTSGYV